MEDRIKKTLDKWTASRDLCIEFSTPYFEKFVRFYRLFAGAIPPELDGTYSKVMLNIAFAMIENELPRSTRALSTTDWFRLQAKAPELEYPAQAAQKWLKYQVENIQNFSRTIIPTLQSVHVFGVGYRIYSHAWRDVRVSESSPVGNYMGVPMGFETHETLKQKSIVSGQFTSVFNVLPFPTGSLVNPVDDTMQSASDGCIWIDYMTESKIREFAEKGIFDGEQVTQLFKIKGSSANHPAETYLQDAATTKSNWNNFSYPQWVRQVRGRNQDLVQRYMVGWLFERDKWTAVAEDRFVLYDGPPAIDAIPIAKFEASCDMENWFGKGLIEISEDLILSMMINFNHRLDYLAGVMHPVTYVPEELLDFHNGDKSIFDQTAYSVIPYPARIQSISQAIFRDRFPSVTQQTFVDEDRMNRFMEKVTGQSDLLKGLAGGNSIEGTATGVSNLVNEGTARSMMRAMNIETSGMRDSLWLTLKYGDRFHNEEEWIREPSAENGFPWSKVPVDAITDQYGIEVVGSRSLQMAEETFRKQMALSQFLINNPIVKNQPLLLKQLMQKSGAFDDIDSILGNQMPDPEVQVAQLEQQRNQGGASTPANDQQSMMGRNRMSPQGQVSGAGEPIV